MSLRATHAMILAAGLGLRMRPLTDHLPKPLVKVAGKALIDYGFDKLRAAGVQHAVVNMHHQAEHVMAWSEGKTNPAITLSDERNELLDTGGGVAKALPHLGQQPFFVLNSDSFWIDEGVPALDRLCAAWNGTTMDCLLLLCPVEKTIGYDGNGDFDVKEDGRIVRKRGGSSLVYIGCYLMHRRLLEDAPHGKFSMNALWDRAIAGGRLHGLAHHGKWLHVGTPGAIALAETELAKT
jgi:MurNAc alpha-1-phosphate uridylyltransferase